MQRLNNNKLLLLLITIGILFRFYNLNWGSPFYFHPDERNIVELVLRSSFLDLKSLTVGTFAYGNFPVMLTLLLKPLIQPFLQLTNINEPFAQTTITLRFISAIFSTLTLYVVYLCGKFWSEKIGLLALFLATFSTGFIQHAHFGTYDTLAAFSAVTVFYFSLKFTQAKKISNFYFALFFIALGASAKINLLVLTIFPGILLLSHFKKQKRGILKIFKYAILGMVLLFLLTVILSPNYLMSEFWNALLYERDLVTGTTPVFYTQSFANTTPVLFQFLHIYPFLINPLLTSFLIPALLYLLLKRLKTKNKLVLLLIAYYLLLFIPQSLLFAKWTRYMIPTLPFIYLIIAVAISSFYSSSDPAIAGNTKSNNKTIKQISSFLHSRQARAIIIGSILTSSTIFSTSYFIAAFVEPDTRIQAAKFAIQNFPNNSRIITEPYDLGIMPFNAVTPNIEFLNSYDSESPLTSHLSPLTSSSDYIILPSQRLLRSRLQSPNSFPKGHDFYSKLVSSKSAFEKIYETPCDIFCKIAYLGDPVFQFEETVSVFDRPTIFIFKNTD